jgi:replicative DNA helicase
MSALAEQKCAAAALRSFEHVERLADSRIDETYFEDEHVAIIVGFAIRFARRERELPTSHALELFLQSKNVETGPYLEKYRILLETPVSNGELRLAIQEVIDARNIRDIEDTIGKALTSIEKNKSASEIITEFKESASDLGRGRGIRYAADGDTKTSADARLEECLKRQANPEAFQGVLSGWNQFDLATNGIQRGELFVVLGEAGFGKTTYLLNFAEHSYSTHDHRNVAFFSLEMPKLAMELRLDTRIAQRLFPDSGITYRAIRDGRMTQPQVNLYRQVVEFQRDRRNIFYIADDPCQRVSEIRDKVEGLRQQHGGEWLVLVDYLGILPESAGGWEAVSNCTQKLFTCGRELEVPLLTAGQLNPEGGIALSYLIKAHSSVMLRITASEEDRMLNEIQQEFTKNREGALLKFRSVKDYDRMIITDVVDSTEAVEEEKPVDPPG